MNITIAKPAISGAIGTSFMTIFSALVSEKKNRQFREHKILKELLKIFPLENRNRSALAWVGHYTMGMAFNVINQYSLKKIKTPPTILNGILLGAINGIIGISIWKIIFAIHPSPPKIELNRYLAHLMLAHLVFATFSNISSNVVQKPKHEHQF